MRKSLLTLGIAVLLCLANHVASAERPPAPKLLPERTAALVRMRNFSETRAKFGETAMGKILKDEQVGPFVSKLYQSVQEAYSQVEDRVGVPLDQLLKIPQGEMFFAVVPSTSGPPALAILIEAKDQMPTVNKLLARGEELHTEGGGTKTSESSGDVKLNIYLRRGANPPAREVRKNAETGEEREVIITPPGTFVQFENEGTIVICNSLELAHEMVASWGGKQEKTLADNERFAAIMSRCQTGSEPPGFEWYADPIAIVKSVAQGNVTAQTGLAFLPVLGVDGIQAVGGSMAFAAGEFDSVSHLHLLLESPKSGVLELLAMTSGDATPEAFVPHDVISYSTVHWDVRQTYEKGIKLVDSFTFTEGRGASEVKNRVDSALGVDFATELLPAMEGRFTFIGWAEPPARINGQANLLGVQLTDAKAFLPTFEKIMAKYPERLSKKSFGSTEYYELTLPTRREISEEESATFRRPEPCFAIVGDYLLASDSPKFLEHAIKTITTGKSLANELDYKLIASKISRQVGGAKPGMITFSRPEEGMRMLYDLATSENTKRQLERQGENNPFFKSLDGALKENPLPPFARIAKYLAPSGGMMTMDETGIHFTSFTLKRN